ncbi:MAG: hypothetical protein H6710_02240 [Myxococcales bacterium]|nr:hypothetical protein [Myxococcales bacterium]
MALIDALDRRPAAAVGARRIVGDAAAPAEARSEARPRVRARRSDEAGPTPPRIHAHAQAGAEPPELGGQGSGPRSRPRVQAHTQVPEGGVGRLDHTPSQAVVVAKATAQASEDNTHGGPTTTASAPAAQATSTPAAPTIDVDALVDTVKRRLAREIRWERELRRAIG